MEAEFWHNRWQEGRIGFHQPDVNKFLKNWWPKLKLPRQSRVFVPLCGKTLDMLWLASQGHQVIGVELSEVAAQAFFAEQNVQPDRQLKGDFTCYSANGVEIWCGDFFDLKRADLQDVTAVFDRAALIALPKAMRQRYVEHLRTLIPNGCQLLLVSMEYDESALSGPPFHVPWSEITDLFDHQGELKILSEQQSDARGTPCLERLYLLTYGSE
ncbi:MAG: thiopurine S-methyltransferase [Pseudomonadales bacterium]